MLLILLVSSSSLHESSKLLISAIGINNYELLYAYALGKIPLMFPLISIPIQWTLLYTAIAKPNGLMTIQLHYYFEITVLLHYKM